MLDIGWTELLVVGVVALIVVGPRDLPGALRTFGKYVGQVRRMARQFQDGIDDIARQEDLRELQRTVTDVTDPKAIDKYLSSDVDDSITNMKIGSIAPNADRKAGDEDLSEKDLSEAELTKADLSEIDGADETLAAAETSAPETATGPDALPKPNAATTSS
jgi:sec-independent protein translocase protein TatB